jgi:hypothetical protein
MENSSTTTPIRLITSGPPVLTAGAARILLQMLEYATGLESRAQDRFPKAS